MQAGIQTQSVASSRYYRITSAVLAATALFSLVYFCNYAFQAVRYPYPLDYGEGQVVEQALRLAAGENIYRTDFDTPPYVIANYPPVFSLLIAPGLILFGPAFWSARLVSTLAALACALALGLIVHTLTRSRLAGATAGGIFLAVPFVLYWAPFVRIDMAGLMFSLLGGWVAVRWPHRWQALATGAALIVTAVYTRQSFGLAVPLALVVSFFLQGRRREAVIFSAWFAALGLAVLLLLNGLTGGGFFFSTITANVQEWRMELLWPIYIFLGATILLVGYLLIRKPWFRQHAFIGVYLVGGTITGMTIAKVGANVNYLNEWFAGLAMVLGLLVAQAGTDWRKLGLTAALVITLTAAMARVSDQIALSWLHNLSRPAYTATLEEMRALIRSADGPVLADDYLGLVVLEGKPIYLQPFDMSQLSRSGLWDQIPLLQQISDGEISLILITAPPGSQSEKERWTPEMLAEIRAHYSARRLGSTTVYTPQP